MAEIQVQVNTTVLTKQLRALALAFTRIGQAMQDASDAMRTLSKQLEAIRDEESR